MTALKRKQRSPGRPFKKGDPRINKHGPKSRDAQVFAVLFGNALANGGDPAELSKILWDKAKHGQPWAIEMLLDRIIGKVSQSLEHSGAINLIVSNDFLPQKEK